MSVRCIQSTSSSRRLLLGERVLAAEHAEAERIAAIERAEREARTARISFPSTRAAGLAFLAAAAAGGATGPSFALRLAAQGVDLDLAIALGRHAADAICDGGPGPAVIGVHGAGYRYDTACCTTVSLTGTTVTVEIGSYSSFYQWSAELGRRPAHSYYRAVAAREARFVACDPDGSIERLEALVAATRAVWAASDAETDDPERRRLGNLADEAMRRVLHGDADAEEEIREAIEALPCVQAVRDARDARDAADAAFFGAS